MAEGSEVDRIFRERDPDRWLAHLFAPADRRPDMAALHAFSSEIARVRDVVHEPMAGEIRLQWWRDVLAGGDPSGHPVAVALLETVGRRSLPLTPLVALIEAREFDLYDDPMPTLGDLEGYAGETSSVLVQLSSIVLAGEDPGTADAAGHAGVAWAIAGLLRALPVHAARGQVFVPAEVLLRHGATPEDVRGRKATPGIMAALAELREHAIHHVERARDALEIAAAEVGPAFLHVALVADYLQRLERTKDPFREPVALPQWRRQFALWRAAGRARRGRTIF